MVTLFELCNSQETFTMLMNLIFHKKINKFIVLYINNILVFFKSKKDHKVHLEIDLKKLCENQLYTIREKSVFNLEELKFLVHVIKGKGLKIDPKKIQATKI